MNGARSITCLLGLATLVVALSPAAARANFTSAQLAQISASPSPEATLPLELSLQDENGRPTTIGNAIGGVPAIVIFADYTCRTLCGPIVEFTVAGLAKTGLRPGTDYHLVVIGINPRDGDDAARAMRARHIESGNPIGASAVFLHGPDAAVHRAAQAVGLQYAYDRDHDQYAHPAAAYIVDATGRVRRLLSPIGFDGGDLRLAIIDAGNGAVGTFADRLHLLCYGFDPARGVYTERITTLLALFGVATLIAMASGIFAMVAIQRRRSAP
jgi:protein SCO1/2